MHRSDDNRRYPITEYFRADPSQPPPGLAGSNIPSSPKSVKIEYQGLEIEVVDVYGAVFVDAPENWLSSAPAYVPCYTLGEANEAYDDRPYYAVILRGRHDESVCCLVRASGHTNEPTAHCVAAIDDQLALAIGHQICGLAIPTLALRWSIEGNDARRYGVLISPDNMGFISHAGTDVIKIGFTGNVVWKVSAERDSYFVEDFSVLPDHVDASADNGSIYRIDYCSGETTILPSDQLSTPRSDRVSIQHTARVPASSDVRSKPRPGGDPVLKFLLAYVVVFVLVVLLAGVSYVYPRLWVLYAGLPSAWIIKANIQDAKQHIINSKSIALGIFMAIVTVALAWLLFR